LHIITTYHEKALSTLKDASPMH